MFDLNGEVCDESKRNGGKKDLQYLRKYAKTIMRYNNSSNYAIGVMRLAYDTHKGLTTK
nr:lytic murein transglycosylase [Sulfurimonas sp. SAG-AH-194-I05]